MSICNTSFSKTANYRGPFVPIVHPADDLFTALTNVSGDRVSVSERVRVRLGSSAWSRNKRVDGLSLWGSVGTVLWKFELRPYKVM